METPPEMHSYESSYLAVLASFALVLAVVYPLDLVKSALQRRQDKTSSDSANKPASKFDSGDQDSNQP